MPAYGLLSYRRLLSSHIVYLLSIVRPKESLALALPLRLRGESVHSNGPIAI